MQAKLEKIDRRNFEILKDAIGSILAVEMPSQAVLNNLSYLNTKIYSERIGAIQASEMPAINIIATDFKFSDYTQISCIGSYTYVIEVYTNSESTSSINGDQMAALKAHRIAGVVQAILMNQAYKYLGLNDKIVNNKSISSIQRAVPRNNDDALNTVMLAMNFEVKVLETVSAGNGIAFDSSLTNVTITESGDGMEYLVEK